MFNCRDINYNDVLHYLGGNVDLLNNNALFDDVKKEMFELSSLRKIVIESDVVIKDDYYYIVDLDLHLKSNEINKKFINVEKILTMAVTLGAMIDKKIQYYGKCDMLRSVILDAMSNVFVENYIDELEQNLRQKYENYNFTMRYSCGYGDLSLDMQPKIIASLQAEKLIGISVTQNHFMTPMKSITAFIGLSKQSQQTDKSPCEICSLKGKCNLKCRKAMQYNEMLKEKK